MSDEISSMDKMEWVIHREVDRPVAAIRWEETDRPIEEHGDVHIGLALALEELRWDDTVRVVIYEPCGTFLDNLAPGEQPKADQKFSRPGYGYDEDGQPPRRVPLLDNLGPMGLHGPWSNKQSIERTFDTLARFEKPIIAKWTANAAGFTGNAMWGCDIIVAREDVWFLEVHLSTRFPAGMNVTAGDGVLAFLPLFLTPTKLKELVLLSPTVTAAQLAELNVVNYALPADEVDAKVEYFIGEFLARPPIPLIRTKRALNKRMIEQVNLTLDYGVVAEVLDGYQAAILDHEAEMTLQPDLPKSNGYHTYMGGGNLTHRPVGDYPSLRYLVEGGIERGTRERPRP